MGFDDFVFVSKDINLHTFPSPNNFDPKFLYTAVAYNTAQDGLESDISTLS